jgi:hypothetical protein
VATAREVAQEWTERLMQRPNVVGVSGEQDEIVVFLEREPSPEEEVIPPEIEGFPTRIVVSGRPITQ